VLPVLLFAIAPTGDAEAEVFPVGPIFQVNAPTPGRHSSPAVAQAENGTFVIVWSADDGDQRGVVGLRFDADGAPLGTEFAVNSYTSGSQLYPAVATAPDGSFVVVWYDQDGRDGDGGGVFLRRFLADGQPVGQDAQVNQYTTGSQGRPAVATASDGNFVITWSNAAQGVAGRRFAANGAPHGTQFQVAPGTPTGVGTTHLSIAPDGSFVVLWEPGTLVQGARFASDAMPLGTTFTVRAGARAARVAHAADGAFAIVWESFDRPEDELYGVFGKPYDSSGAESGAEFHVNTFTTGWQHTSAIASSDDGGFTVVWLRSFAPKARDDGLFGQRLDAAAQPLGTEFPITDQASVFTTAQAIGSDGAGNFVVTWQALGNGGDEPDVFAQRLRTAESFPALCGPSPLPPAGCKSADKSALTMVGSDGGSDERIVWKWVGGATAGEDFKDPVASLPDYRLCIYDSSAEAQPLRNTVILPAITCGHRPCWKASGDLSLRYRNETGVPDGVTRFKLAAKPSLRGAIKLKASGPATALPLLPLVPPVTVQLLVADQSSTECWHAQLETITRNTTFLFKGKGP